MKRLLFVPAPAVLILIFLGAAQEVQAVCDEGSNPGQVRSTNPLYNPAFGSWVSTKAQALGDTSICEDYISDLDSNSNYLTAETSESNTSKANVIKTWNSLAIGEYEIPIIANASANGSISSLSVSGSVYEYGYTAGATTNVAANILDVIKIEIPSASATTITKVPVTFCSSFSSSSEGITHYTKSGVVMAGFNVLTGSGYELGRYDKLIIPSGKTIQHSGTGQTCYSGDLEIKGNHALMNFKLYTDTLGKQDTQTLFVGKDSNGNSYYHTVKIREGTVTATFKLGKLPSDASCYSYSGVFPGCDRKPIACSDGGTPLAVSTDRQTDYSNGIFSLTRNYQNNGICEPKGCGVDWHSSYDKTANFILSPKSNTVDVTDENGLMTIFREKTTGIWEAVDDGITSTFANVYDGTTHTGYVHTTASGIKDHYDLNGVLTSKELTGGEVLSVAYDGSNRLSTITEIVSNDNLSFSYNASDQVTSIQTPSGTVSYAYDANNNLTSVTKPDSSIRTYHHDDATNVTALTGITDETGTFKATPAYAGQGFTQEQFNRLKALMFKLETDLVPLPSYEAPTFVYEPHSILQASGKTFFLPTGNPPDNVEVLFQAMALDERYKGDLNCTADPYGLFDFYETLVHEHMHYKEGPDPSEQPDLANEKVKSYKYRGQDSVTGKKHALIDIEAHNRMKLAADEIFNEFCTCMGPSCTAQ